MKKTHLFVGLLVLSPILCTNLMAQAAHTAREAPIQSKARPLDLPVEGPVYEYASDARAADFYTNVMPQFLTIINQRLAERVKVEGVEAFKLDPSRLMLRTSAEYPIRIYFLYEGAGFHNTLGYSWTVAGADQPGPQIVLFPDASLSHKAHRTKAEPLLVGDFVEIGKGGNGWQLDFFLLPNGAHGRGHSLWAHENRNIDGLQHMVAFMIPNSRYILLGFEDMLHGGDRDYNDALFVVDIGQENAENLFREGSLPH